MSEKTLGPVAAKVKAEAIRQGIKQADLGRAAGMTQAGVSRRLTGDVDITVTEAERFAQILGVSVAWLFGEAEAPALQDA